jgi:hypothetical protein
MYMPKTTLTLSGPVAEMLKVYTVQIKNSLHAQSQVVEEALVEFFEKRGFKIKSIKKK